VGCALTLFDLVEYRFFFEPIGLVVALQAGYGVYFVGCHVWTRAGPTTVPALAVTPGLFTKTDRGKLATAAVTGATVTAGAAVTYRYKIKKLEITYRLESQKLNQRDRELDQRDLELDQRTRQLEQRDRQLDLERYKVVNGGWPGWFSGRDDPGPPPMCSPAEGFAFPGWWVGLCLEPCFAHAMVSTGVALVVLLVVRAGWAAAGRICRARPGWFAAGVPVGSEEFTRWAGQVRDDVVAWVDPDKVVVLVIGLAPLVWFAGWLFFYAWSRRPVNVEQHPFVCFPWRPAAAGFRGDSPVVWAVTVWGSIFLATHFSTIVAGRTGTTRPGCLRVIPFRVYLLWG
jgi:hypothetical protein